MALNGESNAGTSSVVVTSLNSWGYLGVYFTNVLNRHFEIRVVEKQLAQLQTISLVN